ncbi:hypothetical protein M2160_008961 [Streptomyces sp. SAI-117]|nr:hypothetical protein [Streptomyces sp. SAI-117]
MEGVEPARAVAPCDDVMWARAVSAPGRWPAARKKHTAGHHIFPSGTERQENVSMAGDKADVKHFNIKQMENFRDNEVEPVLAAARKHREDGDGASIRPLIDLIDGQTTPDNLGQDTQLLRLGRMASEPLVSGPTLLEGVRASATALDKLLSDQMSLFKEVKAALTETIDGAIKIKDENLSKIDAQTLLMNFEDVDALTSGGTEEAEETGGAS